MVRGNLVIILLLFLLNSILFSYLPFSKELRMRITEYMIAGKELEGTFEVSRLSNVKLKLSYRTRKDRFVYLFIFDLKGRYIIRSMGYFNKVEDVSEIADIPPLFSDEVLFLQLLFSDRRIDFQIGNIIDAVYLPIARTNPGIEYLWNILFPEKYTTLILEIPRGFSIKTEFGIFSSGILRLRVPTGIHEFEVLYPKGGSCKFRLEVVEEKERVVKIPSECLNVEDERKGGFSNLVLLSQPYSEVVVNGEFYGYTNEDGYIKIENLKTGRIELEVRKRGFARSEMQMLLYEGVNCIEVNLKRAFRITLVSNVVPYRIFVDGEYYGTVYSRENSVMIPQGYHRFRFENFEMYTLNLYEEIHEERRIYLNFRKLPLRGAMDLYSMNNRMVIGVTVSKGCEGSLRILNVDGDTVYEENLKLAPGINKILWKPRRNGKYVVKMNIEDEIGEKLKMIREISISTVPTVESELPKFFITSTIAAIIGATLAIFISSIR